MQPQELHPQQLLLQEGLGQHFLHLHLGSQGFGGHLRSQEGLLHELHPQHPAERLAEAPKVRAAAARPNAIGLKKCFIIKTPNLRIPHTFTIMNYLRFIK